MHAENCGGGKSTLVIEKPSLTVTSLLSLKYNCEILAIHRGFNKKLKKKRQRKKEAHVLTFTCEENVNFSHIVSYWN